MGTDTDRLKKDKGLREAWHANIAMAFKDAYSIHMNGKKYPSREDIHIVANAAADYFIDILTDDTKPGDKNAPDGMAALSIGIHESLKKYKQ